MTTETFISNKTAAEAVVLRLSPSSLAHSNLASASLLRDSLVSSQIPSLGSQLSFRILELVTLFFDVISINPFTEDPNQPLYGTSKTKFFIIPPIPFHIYPSNLFPFSFPQSFTEGSHLMHYLQLSFTSSTYLSVLLNHNIPRPKLIVVYGPYGSGKTSALSYCIHQLNAQLIYVSAKQILSKHISKQALLNAFLHYIKAAITVTQPTALVLDDSHLVFSNESHQVVSAFVCMMEYLSIEQTKGNGLNVTVIICASSPLSHLHPIILSRANITIFLAVDAASTWTKDMVSKVYQLPERIVNKHWPYQGFSTISEVISWARKLKLHDSEPVDFYEELSDGQSHSKSLSHNYRQRWKEMDSQLGGLNEAQKVLKRLLLWRRTKLDTFKRLNIRLSNGALLYGVPGTGKTALVQLAAQATGFTVISVDAASLSRGEVGASELLLAEKFKQAETTVPCIVFIDEIDSLFHTAEGKAPHLQRLVAKLAHLLDTIQEHIVVIGATNRPWAISRPLLRPGRFEHCVQVPLPDAEAREKIGAIYASKMMLNESATTALRSITTNFATTGMSGADIAGACRRAAMRAYCRSSEIEEEDLRCAFAESKPSVKPADAFKLNQWRIGHSAG